MEASTFWCSALLLSLFAVSLLLVLWLFLMQHFPFFEKDELALPLIAAICGRLKLSFVGVLLGTDDAPFQTEHLSVGCLRPTGSGLAKGGSESLPNGSNVVPFWVCYGFWVRNYNILPKKELHRRVWVDPEP